MLYIRGTSQGSVAAYLILKSVNIWQNYKQKRGCLVHFLRLLAVCWPGASGARVTGTAAAACDGRTRRAGSFSREWRCRRPCLCCDRSLYAASHARLARSTSALYAACVSLFLRTVSAVANTPIRHQASATVKTKKTAVDRGRRSDRPRYHAHHTC